MKKRKILSVFSILLLSLLPVTSCVNSSSNNQDVDSKEDDKKEDDNINKDDDRKEDEKPLVCEHEYEKKVMVEADCKTKELDLYTCKKCKYSYKEYGDYGEHNYQKEITQVADCIHKEETTYICSVCNDTYKEYGDYGEHNIKEKYHRNDLNITENEFTKTSYCSVCNEVFEEETVKYKDHHYILESDTGTQAIYKCIVCDDKIEYTFNIKDFNYSINFDNSLDIKGFNGSNKNVYIPSDLIINNKKITRINSLRISNNSAIERLKLESNVDNSSFFNTVIENNSNLKYIDLENTSIEAILWYNESVIYNNPSLKEVLFPKNLKSIYCESKVEQLDKLDFSKTDLEYFTFGEELPETLILPTSIRVFFDKNTTYLKDIVVESNDILGSLYATWQGRGVEWIFEKIKYLKSDEFDINVNLIYPNGSKKTLKLPYGSNLFKSEEYLKLLKEDDNRKIGWYKEKTCYDYFSGILPKKDFTSIINYLFH